MVSTRFIGAIFLLVTAALLVQAVAATSDEITITANTLADQYPVALSSESLPFHGTGSVGITGVDPAQYTAHATIRARLASIYYWTDTSPKKKRVKKGTIPTVYLWPYENIYIKFKAKYTAPRGTPAWIFHIDHSYWPRPLYMQVWSRVNYPVQAKFSTNVRGLHRLCYGICGPFGHNGGGVEAYQSFAVYCR